MRGDGVHERDEEREARRAYFLLSIYGPPAQRWEEGRSLFYGGLASRSRPPGAEPRDGIDAGVGAARAEAAEPRADVADLLQHGPVVANLLIAILTNPTTLQHYPIL